MDHTQVHRCFRFRLRPHSHLHTHTFLSHQQKINKYHLQLATATTTVTHLQKCNVLWAHKHDDDSTSGKLRTFTLHC